MGKCLVVGANGFLGSYLVDELVRLGHDVTAFDRFSRETATYTAEGVVKFAGDFMNQADIVEAVRGQRFVFHMVSTTTPATAENDPTLDVRTNIASSIELFQHCVDAGVERVSFASTGGAIYGNEPDGATSEAARAMPISPYAIGKLAIEGYLRYFGAKYGLESVAFRISNPYGPRQRTNRKQGVIPIFLNNLAEGRPLTVFGDGSMVRDYVFASDVARMIGETADRPLRHTIYNVGSGHGASLLELLGIMERVTGIHPMIETQPTPKTFVDKVVLDTSRFRAEFGFEPFVSLEDGIAATWQQLQAASG